MGKIQKAIAAIYAEKQEMGKIRQKDLAKALGCSQATVSHILNGSRTLSEKWIEALCEQLDIKLGDIEEATSHPPDPKELREAINKLRTLYNTRPKAAFQNIDRNLDDWLQILNPIQDYQDGESRANVIKGNFTDFPDAERIEEPRISYLDSDAPRPVEIFRVPHYDAIPAGNPRGMNPEGQMWMDIVHSKGKDTWYTLRVVGDSMSPDYLNGDVVLMDYALQPRDGDVVAALIDGTESTLKIYSRQGDEITLTPIETKRHSPRTFHASRVTIQGVLVEIVRRSFKRKTTGNPH
jgi:SOS-response transcriptional repressor LexA